MRLFIRTIGIARATTKIGMANLVYNIKRLIFLRKIAQRPSRPGGKAPIRGYLGPPREISAVRRLIGGRPSLSEPVSSPNSLLAGKMQGIFANFNRIGVKVHG
jgi:hypothetical protein